MISPPKTWKWFGHPGHFIAAQDCRFHLCTQVGPWLISTVGEYLPDAPVREILAESRGVALAGKGDARRADYIEKIGFQEIGYERKFETMVFRAGEPCSVAECNCGLPKIDGLNLDFLGYNTAGEANAGHALLCLRWAERDANWQGEDEP